MTFWCGSADPYPWLMDLDQTQGPTPFFSDFKDAKKNSSFFSYNLPAGTLSSVAKTRFFCEFGLKFYFANIISVRSTPLWEREVRSRSVLLTNGSGSESPTITCFWNCLSLLSNGVFILLCLERGAGRVDPWAVGHGAHHAGRHPPRQRWNRGQHLPFLFNLFNNFYMHWCGFPW
jgi:hypothetical protein